MANTINAAETQKQVDRLCLYDRFAQPIYDNRIAHGQWQHPPHANQVFAAERSRTMTSEEAYQFATDWEAIIQQLEEPERNATTQEKAIIREHYTQAVEQAMHISSQASKFLMKRIEIVKQLVNKNLSAQDIKIVMRQFDKRALADLHNEIVPQTKIQGNEFNR